MPMSSVHSKVVRLGSERDFVGSQRHVVREFQCLWQEGTLEVTGLIDLRLFYTWLTDYSSKEPRFYAVRKPHNLFWLPT